MKEWKGTIAIVGLAFAALWTRSFANAQDACDGSSDGATHACLVAARSEHALARAKCQNLAASGAAANCRRQASLDKRDAFEECAAQGEAREAVCVRLGPAPYDPVINPANFVTTIDNPYFPLTPGTKFVYEGNTVDGFEHNEFLVTHQTRRIRGVTCVEVRDTVMVDGELTEDTFDWFAQDVNGNVWYFGENTHEQEDGLITTLAGSFMAGIDGAKAGIIMKANPAVGDFYRQEFSLDNAEDLAEVLSLSDTANVPYGSFTQCLKTQETTPLEPDLLEHKLYAAGVGNVLTVDAHTGERRELVAVTTE